MLMRATRNAIWAFTTSAEFLDIEIATGSLTRTVTSSTTCVDPWPSEVVPSPQVNSYIPNTSFAPPLLFVSFDDPVDSPINKNEGIDEEVNLVLQQSLTIPTPNVTEDTVLISWDWVEDLPQQEYKMMTTAGEEEEPLCWFMCDGVSYIHSGTGSTSPTKSESTSASSTRTSSDSNNISSTATNRNSISMEGTPSQPHSSSSSGRTNSNSRSPSTSMSSSRFKTVTGSFSSPQTLSTSVSRSRGSPSSSASASASNSFYESHSKTLSDSATRTPHTSGTNTPMNSASRTSGSPPTQCPRP